ncbi:MAG: undecaprenyl-diphosphate phosphatase [Eubacteriales bacterium]
MFFIEILKAIFLGIVEGITEWLPISSTGHMILVDEFIKLDVSKEFLDMFMVVIQLEAILAVLVPLLPQTESVFTKENTCRTKTDMVVMVKSNYCLPAGSSHRIDF